MNYINQKKVKIRKPHNCWGCAREFSVGSIMERNTQAEGLKICSIYWCDDCMEYMSNAVFSSDDMFSYGELLEDDGYREKLFGDINV
jgi:hypothetical protein